MHIENGHSQHIIQYHNPMLNKRLIMSYVPPPRLRPFTLSIDHDCNKQSNKRVIELPGATRGRQKQRTLAHLERHLPAEPSH